MMRRRLAVPIDPAGGRTVPSTGLLIILCGLPASGKTTLAGLLARKMDGVQVISSDVSRRQIGSHRLWARMAEEVRKGLLAGKTMVVDATNYNEDHRNRYVSIAAQANLPFVVVHLDAGVPTLLDRNRRRVDAVPEEAIRRLAGIFDPPRGGHTITINTEDLRPEEVFEATRAKIPDGDREGPARDATI